MKKVVYIFLFLFSIVSCTSDNDELTSLYFGYEYYPLSLNQEHIFQVDSIIYDDFSGTVDTFSHQRRELVQSIFLDSERRTIFEVTIFERLSENTKWVQKKQINRTKTPIRIEELNDNLITVPIVFPIKEKLSWDSNVLNTKAEENFYMETVHMPLDLGNTSYDSTLIVVQREEDQLNILEQHVTKETYASNVGLILREDLNVRTTRNQVILSGYHAKISLLEFKKGD